MLKAFRYIQRQTKKTNEGITSISKLSTRLPVHVLLIGSIVVVQRIGRPSLIDDLHDPMALVQTVQILQSEKVAYPVAK
jgi:hypothetical protein